MSYFILKSCSLLCSSLKLKTGSSCPLIIGQINYQSASCLKNQSLAGFWMPHEKNRLKFSLQLYLSWWPLLTAIPKPHQCHFAYTAEGLVLYLNYEVFWLKQAYSQPATRLMEGKVSIGPFSPCSISFNDNAIIGNFYPMKFHSSKLFKFWLHTWREFAYDHLWL